MVLFQPAPVGCRGRICLECGHRASSGHVLGKAGLRSTSTNRVSPRRRNSTRLVWMGCSLRPDLFGRGPDHVAWMGTIGVRCMFGTKVEEEIPARLRLARRPAQDWGLALAIGEVPTSERGVMRITSRRFASLSDQIGKTIEVKWRDQNTRETKSGTG